jgi:hypothetical protein
MRGANNEKNNIGCSNSQTGIHVADAAWHALSKPGWGCVKYAFSDIMLVGCGMAGLEPRIVEFFQRRQHWSLAGLGVRNIPACRVDDPGRGGSLTRSANRKGESRGAKATNSHNR